MALLLQQAGESTGYTFYDTSNKLVVESNPAVKNAYDSTMQIVHGKLSGKYGSVGPGLDYRLQAGQIRDHRLPGLDDRCHRMATPVTARPASGISRASPATAATGADRTSPFRRRASTRSEAAELAKFLTSKDGQIAAFKAKGPLPSNVQALDDPAVKELEERVLLRCSDRRDLR